MSCIVHEIGLNHLLPTPKSYIQGLHNSTAEHQDWIDHKVQGWACKGVVLWLLSSLPPSLSMHRAAYAPTWSSGLRM